MVMDTLRATVRHLAAAPLDHTGRRLSGRRDRPVPSELRLCRPYRRLRPCLAAAGGGVVCAADGVPTVFMVAQERFVLRLFFKCVII